MIILGDALSSVWGVEDGDYRAGHGEDTHHAHATYILVHLIYIRTHTASARDSNETETHSICNRNLDAWRTDTGDRSSANILNHTLRINGSRVLETNSSGLPTGAVTDVEGSPFDFRTAMRIGARWDETMNLGGPGGCSSCILQ